MWHFSSKNFAKYDNMEYRISQNRQCRAYKSNKKSCEISKAMSNKIVICIITSALREYY
jgi:hypothetical protein